MKAKTERNGKAKPEVVKVGNAAVKLYTLNRPGGQYFQIADYSNGKRVLRSFGGYDDAKKEAQRIARLLSTGDATAAAMRNTEAASYGRAIELLRPTGDSLEIVAARYAEAVKILGSGSRLIDAAKVFARSSKMPTKTVPEVIKELLDAKEKKREKRTIDDLRNRLNKFAEAFSVPIATITKSEVQQWLDGLKTSERDKLNYRSKVNTLFRWAWRRDYVLTNPVEKTEKPDPEEGEIHIFKPEELSRLIESARQHQKDFLPCLLIGAFAGLRSSEIERLTWEDVDLKRRHIKASAKKKGTPSHRLVTIRPNLAAWLSDYADKKGKVWRGSHDEYYEAQNATVKATATGSSPALEWHEGVLRHSFGSYLLALTGNSDAVKLQMGHEKDTTTLHSHYKHLVTKSDGKAWFSISPAKPENVVSIRKAS